MPVNCGTTTAWLIVTSSFAIAVIKLDSNTSLLGNPDVNTLLCEWFSGDSGISNEYSCDIDDGIHIGIWNSIENDFVLSAACLPYAPPFFRACKLFMHTYITSFSQRLHSKPFRSLDVSSRSGRLDDSLALELAHNGELPGTAGRKIEIEHQRCEQWL